MFVKQKQTKINLKILEHGQCLSPQQVLFSHHTIRVIKSSVSHCLGVTKEIQLVFFLKQNSGTCNFSPLGAFCWALQPPFFQATVQESEGLAKGAWLRLFSPHKCTAGTDVSCELGGLDFGLTQHSCPDKRHYLLACLRKQVLTLAGAPKF